MLSFFQRIFLSLSIISVVLINITLFLSYYLTEKNYINTVKKNILIQIDTIKTFLVVNNNIFNPLPINNLQKTNNLWLFFDIRKSNILLSTQFIRTNKTIFFQTSYNWYNIIIWKKLDELNYIKHNYIKSALLISFVSILFVLLISYIISKWLLKPINDIIKNLQSYKLWENMIIKNDYSGKDLWILIEKINNFIQKINYAYSKQRNFLQDISHEIKTPLMQILSTIELMEDDFGNNNKDFQMIKERINYISDLINKILFIEKLDWKLINEEINLNKYIKEFISYYNWLLNEKWIKLKIVEKANLYINANKYYLDRLFWNIISNSIKYNKKNWEIIIIIDKKSITIKDTWIWIDKEDINKIFNRFYKWKYSNWTWLWLAIAKKIIEILNFKIEINSEKWKWTVVKITFA